MAALDFIHDAVKNALIKDGWTITADPYTIQYGKDKVYVDLAAERPIAAERNGQKIAVEIKSFLGRSPLHDFEMALGQYMLYKGLLELIEPDRKLYLAVHDHTYHHLLQQDAIRVIVERYQLVLLVVNVVTEEVVQWID